MKHGLIISIFTKNFGEIFLNRKNAIHRSFPLR